MTDEPTYTLAEAKAELTRRECAAEGHDWTIVQRWGIGPVALACDRCGAQRSVARPAVCEYPEGHRDLIDFDGRCVRCGAPYEARP